MTRPVIYRRAQPAYLTVEAFAEHYSVSKMTVYRLIERGDVRANRIANALRIPVFEVARYAAATEVTPDPSPTTREQGMA